MRLTEGLIIDGRYELVRRLGSGGMADVWLARDSELGREVALKVLHDNFARDPEFVTRFRQRGLRRRRLCSTRTSSASSTAAPSRTPITSPWSTSRAPTLRDLINRGLGISEAVEVTRQVLAAAGYAHERGIVHRDLKPMNVLIDRSGRVRVTDFGIARAGNSDVTRTGSVLGTAQYLSPEQAQGFEVDAGLRRLLDRRDAVRDARRPRPLRRRQRRRDRDEAGLRARRRRRAASTRPCRRRSTRSCSRRSPRTPPPATCRRRRCPPRSTLPRRTRSWPATPSATRPSCRPRTEDDTSNKWWWIGGIVALLLVAAAIWFFFLRGDDGVARPRRHRQGRDDGVARAAEGRLRRRHRRAWRTRSRQGTVLEQDPRGGTRADEGSTVTLFVSSGPAPARCLTSSARPRRRRRRSSRTRDSRSRASHSAERPGRRRPRDRDRSRRPASRRRRGRP